jgi:hypothetical protein
MSSGASPSRPTKLTIEEFHDLKDLFSENPLIKWSIIAAGLGGALEAIHILWLLAVRLGVFH